jgi:hypothetical protein
MKEKVLKILSNYTDFNGNTDSIETNLKMNKAYLAEELSTLIQQEREEAVWKFADWCDSLSYEYEDSGGNAMVMEELVKTYLQSLDKGDTDERN